VAIAGVATAGLSPEQLDQLVYATTDAPASAPLVVLRRGEHELRTIELPAPLDPEVAPDLIADLPSYRVRYGTSDALVVEIHDVRADLADELVATIKKQRAEDARPIAGMLLDLRDDGGGSTDGAITALGLFLPDAPLFPMARRDGSIEVDRAPTPRPRDRWTGAIATLVDQDTASAAEMIAGGLAAYHRGPVVGTPTYGKGCAQEYLDDDARTGILRLTTLLYALPDGSPVQGVGLEPVFLLPRRTGPEAVEREADVPHAPPTWRGPDVRDPTLIRPATAGDGMSWPDPSIGGGVGPCRDSMVCQALRALGSPSKRPLAVKTPVKTR
jgi:carboxyl-terminal processing protease